MSKDLIFQQLSQAVVDGNEENAVIAAQRAIETGTDAGDAITQGLSKGMDIVGTYFERQRYFLPEVVVSSLAFHAGVDVLKPHIKVEQADRRTVVLGTVQGDTHDIGKNLVAILFRAAGYDVQDVGKDVAPEAFVAKVRETGADLLGLSALMTTSMVNMKGVITLLERDGLRGNVKVIVGGAPVSQRYSYEIGADGYAANAAGAVRLAKALFEEGSEAAVRGRLASVG